MNSIIFITLALSVFDQPFKNDQDWSNYKVEYNKNYLNKQEEILRYSNFKINDKRIKAHNEKYSKGKIGYEMGHNQFSDMSKEEFAAIYLHPIKAEKEDLQISFNSSLQAPDELSYQSYCFPPLNQGSCGSCWAFSATAQVEAQLKRKDSSFNAYISPQYVLDCSGAGNCEDGGRSGNALSFMKNNGLVALKDYSYTEHDGSCKKGVQKMSQKIQSTSIQFLRGNEESLKNILANVGPAVVSIYVMESFNQYSSGIYWDESCPNDCQTTHHAVLLVGYGTDKTTFKEPVDYWIIKNSWGPKWGESGYFRMIRGWNSMKNNCNTACYARYAIV